MRDRLTIWTVYDHPKDYPFHYVARRFEVVAGQLAPIITHDIRADTDLDLLRERFAYEGLTRMPRQDGDDKTIIETWF